MPLKIKLILEGATRLEYKIITKKEFKIIGKSRRFNVETSYKEIPKGYEVKAFPAGMWAVFPCRGALPETLQNDVCRTM